MEWTNLDDRAPTSEDYPIWIYWNTTERIYFKGHNGDRSVLLGDNEYVWQSIQKPEKPAPPEPKLHRCVSPLEDYYECYEDCFHQLHLGHQPVGVYDSERVIITSV